MMEAAVRIECKGVGKNFRASNGRIVHALRDLDMAINEDEFVCVVGSSGSGKSTLLRILAGLEEPSSGSVCRSSTQGKGTVGLLFQTNSIFPWRTVEQNLGYFLEAKGIPAEERSESARTLCQSVGLDPELYLPRYPSELSGGESRRVAIGMVLSSGPSLLLLDEPTSQLDYVIRRQIQHLIYDLCRERRTAVVCVTHDIDEAITLAQRIVVLGDGRQLDSFRFDLPFPRDTKILASKEAVEARLRIVSRLERVHE